MTTATKPVKGSLVSIGMRNLGINQRYEYFRCVTCGTDYPKLTPFGLPSCNGHKIGRCPWCKEDSKPYTDGRGK